MSITVDILKGIAPGSRITGYKLLQGLADEMNAQFPGAGIDTVQEVRHFLAQAACETDSFNSLHEYASGKDYEGRQDLGNGTPGDGIKYKGRGIFQTTGRANYLRLSILNKGENFIMYPDLLAQPKYAVWSALVFWNDRHLSDIANTPDTSVIFSKTLDRQLTPIQYITYRINGAQNGIDEREMFYAKAKRIII